MVRLFTVKRNTMETFKQGAYNPAEHNHVEWSDEKLDEEMGMCDLLLTPWQVSEERRRQIGQRALLAREEIIHRYGERHQHD